MDNNERILADFEAVGGGYVWDADIFAVTLMDVAADDKAVLPLCGLTGVQQIELDASRLSIEALKRLASIPGLSSLVLNHARLTSEEARTLADIGPEVIFVDE